MFGLSMGHMILLGVIILIFVGPEQMPEVARSIARMLNELRRAAGDFQSHFTGNFDNVSPKRWVEDQLKEPAKEPPPRAPDPPILEENPSHHDPLPDEGGKKE